MDEITVETESNCSMEDAMAVVEDVLRRSLGITRDTHAGDSQGDEIDALGQHLLWSSSCGHFSPHTSGQRGGCCISAFNVTYKSVWLNSSVLFINVFLAIKNIRCSL